MAYLKMIYRHSPGGRRKMPLVCVAERMSSSESKSRFTG